MRRTRIRRGGGNPIPPEARKVVVRREGGLCLRCTMRGYDVHHRRSRRVVDAHTHCPCNMVLLCRTCHSWAHGLGDDSSLAVRAGYKVAQWAPEPGRVVIQWKLDVLMLSCGGLSLPLASNQMLAGPSGPAMVSAGFYGAHSDAG